MNTSRLLASAVAATVIFAGAYSALGAAITPATIAGPSADVFDPTGVEGLDFEATGATSQATLEALDDFRSVQTFTGFTGAAANATSVTNFIDFTGATTFPDIQVTITADSGSGGFQSGAGVSTATVLNTSAGSAATVRPNNAGSTATPSVSTFTLTFGTYSTGSQTLTADQVVDAVGFALVNLRAGHTAAAEFRAFDGSVLSTQTATGATEGSDGTDVFFGFDVPGAATGATGISSIVVTRTTTANGGSSTGLDDLGFSDAIFVPEPGSAGLALCGGIGLLLRRRRG